MSERKRKTVEGKNVFGDDRKYAFFLLDAVTGTRLFHEYISLVVRALPMLGKFFASVKEEEKSGVDMEQISDLISVLPSILTWERVEELAKEMLAGSTLTIDGEVCTANATGFYEELVGDPLEMYTAIFYAILANYPKYVDPFLTALESDESDSSQSQEKTTALN